MFCCTSKPRSLLRFEFSSRPLDTRRLRTPQVKREIEAQPVPVLHPFMCVFPRWKNCTSGPGTWVCYWCCCLQWPWWAPPTRSVAQKKKKSSGRGTICSTATAEQSICIQQNMLQEMERINLRLSMKSPSLPKVKLLLQCFVNMTERDRLLFGGCLPCGGNWLCRQVGCHFCAAMLTLSRLPSCMCDVRRPMSDKLALTSRMRRQNSSVNQHVPTISFRHCWFAHDPCCRSTVDAKHAPSGARDASIAAAGCGCL